MRPSALSQRLDEGLLAFAWDEWAQMGVFALPHRRSRWVQDPEALVVFTLEVARHDPRLFDELLDWLLVNEALLSVRRLRAMCADPEDERLLAGVLGWLARYRPRARLTSKAVPALAGDPELLFRDLTVSVRDPDPAFAAVGLVRPEAKPTGKAVRPDLRTGINLAFRLRELLGVGVRAEVVRFLLTVAAPAVSAQAVARSSGFAKRNVHDALAALHAAGVVSLRTVGNEHRYAIDRSSWTQLLAIDSRGLPQERAWPQLLAGVRKLRRWLRDPGLDELSDYLRASQARDLLEEVRRDFEYAAVPVGSRPAEGAWDDLEALVEDVLLELSTDDPTRTAAERPPRWRSVA
jgi:hypothetical protein